LSLHCGAVVERGALETLSRFDVVAVGQAKRHGITDPRDFCEG
jgi:hypothetical protein